MEDVVRLRCRNAELETELRLLKAQLSEARGATKFLVTCFGAQTASGQQENTRALQERLDEALVENSQLKAALLHHRREGSNGERRDFISNTSPRSRPARELLRRPYVHDEPSPPDSDEERAETFKDEEYSLLDFGSDEEDNHNVSTSRASSLHARTSPSTTTFECEDSEYVVPAVPDDEVCDPIPFTPLQPVITRPRPFAVHEHNRLLGAAAFVEDMDEQQKLEHWKSVALTGGRHSAAEWQQYYEDVVLPKYLMRTRAGGEKVLQDEVPVGDVDEEGEGVKGEGLEASRWAPKTNAKLEIPHMISNDVVRELQLDFVIDMGSPKPEPIDQGEKIREVNRAQTDLTAETYDGGEMILMPTGLDPPSLISVDEALARSATEKSAPETGQELLASPDDTPTQQIATSSDPSPASSSSLPPSAHDDAPPLSEASSYATYYDWMCLLRPATKGDFRTVLIRNLAPPVTLMDVLDKVRGGKIVTTAFFQTAAMNTIPSCETNAVLVTFLYANRAKAFVDFCATQALSIATAVGPCKAVVSLLPTACRPLDPRIISTIHREGLSRVFFIHDKMRWEAEEVVIEILRFDSTRFGICRRPLRITREAGTGILVLEYASIEDAANAIGAVGEDVWFFGGVSKGYLPDPCGRPLKEISEHDDAKEGREEVTAERIDTDL